MNARARTAVLTTERNRIGPGTVVEIRTRFLSNWAPGFEIVVVDGDRVAVRRRSDGAVLPVTISLDDVRPAQISSRTPHVTSLRTSVKGEPRTRAHPVGENELGNYST